MSFYMKDINKRYGKHQVLNSLSLSLAPGECVGILGENGSGKSTLLNLLSGVLRPDSGEFFRDKEELFSHPKLLSRTVGYVPQQPPLMEELTARDHLLLWYDRERLQQDLQTGMLHTLEIHRFLKTPVSKMSGGMKKRLSIACALATRPQLLLLDEPSSALDLKAKQQMADYIRALCRAGTSVLLATHDVGELSLCHRLFLLKNGGLSPFVFDGDCEKLKRSL